jgi:hypothetical protein
LEEGKNFTTFDIVKILDIGRNLLAQWLMRGYIKPSVQQAKGPGTKNLFNVHDLYRIRLFQQLVDSGIERGEAKRYIVVNFENVGPGPDDRKYIIYTRKLKNLKNESGIFAESDLTKIPPTITFEDNDSYVVVINLLGIKKWVDGKLD